MKAKLLARDVCRIGRECVNHGSKSVEYELSREDCRYLRETDDVVNVTVTIRTRNSSDVDLKNYHIYKKNLYCTSAELTEEEKKLLLRNFTLSTTVNSRNSATK